MSLKNKTALVTGASRGIGRAIALALAVEGAKVIVNYNKSEKEARETVEQILDISKKTDNGAQAMALHADISNYKEVQEMFAIAYNNFGNIDILVNNAGIIKDRALKNMSLEEWHSVINTNLNGTFYCCKEAVEIMNDNGKIINIASILGTVGNYGQTNYCASKGGIIAFTKALALELKKRNITVNAIIPGLVETDMTKNLILRGLFAGVMAKKPEEVAKKVIDAIKCSKTGEVISVP
ncbi:3-oxoacyl-ACP reductase FabG [Candidatus Woesearchaeota archaeon]|nr:3-oxoacyl-ACP reductase FabG [Candidatus Woesearchaeota archaeon]